MHKLGKFANELWFTHCIFRLFACPKSRRYHGKRYSKYHTDKEIDWTDPFLKPSIPSSILIFYLRGSRIVLFGVGHAAFIAQRQ